MHQFLQFAEKIKRGAARFRWSVVPMWLRFQKQIQVLAVLLLGISPISGPILRQTQSPTVILPDSLLAEANRLAWLDNWYAAGPLYAEAEIRFTATGDQRNAIYARIGRIRSVAGSASWTDAARQLESEFRKQHVRSDLQLRLWWAALKGEVEFNLNTGSAKRMWQEVLNIATTVNHQQWIARAKGELGIIAFLQGDLIRAVDLMGQSLSTLAASSDVAGQARMMAMTGDAFAMMLRFGEAQWFLGRAISVMTNTPGAGFSYEAHIGRAHALAAQGRLNEANHELMDVVTRAQIEKNSSQEANAFENLGQIALQKSDLERAKECFERAANISRRIQLRRVQAAAMIDLAAVHRIGGDFKNAHVALSLGLAASRKIGDKFYLPRDLTAAAELAVAEHRPQSANRLFRQAETAIDQLVSNEHTDTSKAGISGALSETYLQHFHLLEQEGSVNGALDLLERVRGRTSDIGLVPHGEGLKPSPARDALEAEISEVQVSLLRTDDQQVRLALQDKLMEYERRLAVEDNRLRKPEVSKVPVVSLASFQKTLRADELFLEYVLLDADAFCIAVTAENAQIVQLPASGKQIRDLSVSYLQQLKEKNSDETEAAALYAALVKPVTDLFPKPRLVIAADGNLNLLPFEALRNPNGSFLVQSKIISYTPSATALWTLRRRRPARGSRPLLALGDVDYLSRRVRSTGATERWTPVGILRDLAGLSGAHLQNLPDSRTEVLAIANIAGPGSKVILGKDATESMLRSQPLSDYRIIHLAVHAIADIQYPDRSALVLGEDKPPQDGLLQVREIEGLRLNADLVTLSACETGIGASEREAGVISLERSFLMGGAKAVVASLWNVEDRSTSKLMQAFYRHLAEGEDKATALALAKSEFLKTSDFASPYYWAGFVIVGDASPRILFAKNRRTGVVQPLWQE